MKENAELTKNMITESTTTNKTENSSNNGGLSPTEIEQYLKSPNHTLSVALSCMNIDLAKYSDTEIALLSKCINTVPIYFGNTVVGTRELYIVDADCLKNNGERIIAFIRSLQLSKIQMLTFSGNPFGKLGLKQYINILKTIFDNDGTKLKNLFLNCTFEGLSNEEQLEILYFTLSKIQYQSGNIPHIVMADNTLWTLDKQNFETKVFEIIKTKFPNANITLWPNGKTIIKCEEFKKLPDVKKLEFLSYYLKVETFSSWQNAFEILSLLPKESAEKTGYDLLSEYISYNKKTWKVLSWLEQNKISEELITQLIKQFIQSYSLESNEIPSLVNSTIISSDKWRILLSELIKKDQNCIRVGNLHYLIKLDEEDKLHLTQEVLDLFYDIPPAIIIAFNITKEKLNQLKWPIKRIAEKINEGATLDLTNIPLDSGNSAILAEAISSSYVTSHSTLNLDMIDEDRKIEVANFFNTLKPASPYYNVIISMYLASGNEKEKIENLISFLLNLKTCNYTLNLNIPLAVGFKTYQHFIKEVFEKYKMPFASITLSNTQLSKMKPEEQAELLLMIIKNKTIKHLYFDPNTIWALGTKKLSDLVETIVNNFEGDLYVWQNYNSIIDDQLAKDWDDNRRKEFLKIYIKAKKISGALSAAEAAFKCTLSEKEYFDLFLDYIKDAKNLFPLRIWLTHAKLKEELRFELAKQYVISKRDTDKEDIAMFDLRSEKRLELLHFCNKIDPDIAGHDDFDLYDTPLKESQLLKHFNIPENNDFSIEDYFIFFKNALSESLKICESFWPNSTFYKLLFNNLLSADPQYNNLQKFGDEIGWIIDSLLLFIPKSIEDIKAKDKLLTQLMPKILDFPDNNIRYKLLFSIFDEIWPRSNNEGFTLLEDLIKDQRHWLLLLTIPFSQIVLNAPEKEMKEYNETARNLLKSIPVSYKNGHHYKTLISSIQMLADNKDISVKDKLAMIETVIGNKETLKLQIMHHSNIILTAAQKLKAQRELAKKKKSEQKNVISAKDKLNKQMNLWMLFQGLNGLNLLNTVEANSISKLFNSLQNIFANLFDLSKEETERYSSILSGLRNDGALLTYLNKINTLNKTQKKNMDIIFKMFVKSILSPQSQTFYQSRYFFDNSIHLKKVFDARKYLSEIWKLGAADNLNDYINKHQIVPKDFVLNYDAYFYNRIVKQGHLKPLSCNFIIDYLSIRIVKERENIKQKLQIEINSLKEIIEKNKLQAKKVTIEKNSEEKDKKENSETKKDNAEETNNNHVNNNANNNINNNLTNTAKDYQQNQNLECLLLQLGLINFIESQNLDKSIQLKNLMIFSNHLNKLRTKIELANDVNMLYRRLNIKEHVEKGDFKGWTVVDTDHFWDLFMSGTDVPGSCQRIDGEAKYNKCLLAYVMDGKNRLLAIKDNTGKIQARAIFRILLDSKTEEPVLYMEEIYPYTASSIFRQVLEQFACDRAKMLQLFLLKSSTEKEHSKSYSHPLVSFQGIAPYEYVDANFCQVEKGEFTIDGATIIYSPIKEVETLLSKELFFSKWQGSKMMRIISEYAAPANKEEHESSLLFTWGKLQKQSKELEVIKKETIDKDKNFSL